MLAISIVTSLFFHSQESYFFWTSTNVKPSNVRFINIFWIPEHQIENIEEVKIEKRKENSIVLLGNDFAAF